MASSAPNGTSQPVTLTMLGCGNLGTAILAGILESLSQQDSKDDTGTSEFTPPSRFIACVRSATSAKRIQKIIGPFSDTHPVTILQNDNLKAVQQADVIILGCKPYMIKDVFAQPEMIKALSGKLLISICAGVPVDQISRILYDMPYASLNDDSSSKCRIVRVMPNTAALVRESMTVIAQSMPPLPPQQHALTEWIFKRVGKTVTLAPNLMDASTALCGSGPAFVALLLESLTDGAVAMGIPRADAQAMAVQTMRGTTGLVGSGEHPAIVREKVCTPGGCTAGGLLVLEEGAVRGTVSRAIREATVVASLLGKGVSNVNGTRPYSQ